MKARKLKDDLIRVGIISLLAICLFNACTPAAQEPETPAPVQDLEPDPEPEPEQTETLTVEHVPEFSSPPVSIKRVYENGVEALYLPLPGYSVGRNGVMYTGYGGENGDEVIYYELVEGELEELRVDFYSRKIATPVGKIDVEFYYCFSSTGEAFAYYPTNLQPEVECTCAIFIEDNKKLMLTIAEGRQRDYREYKVVMDFDTGEIDDFLAGIPKGKKLAYRDVSASSDLVWSILRSGEDEDKYYVYNRETGLTEAGEFFDAEVLYCIFLDDKSMFFEDADHHGWYYELDSGLKKQVIIINDDVTFTGGYYAYRVTGGKLVLIDLRTGEEILVEGYHVREDDLIMLSPDSTCFFIAVRDKSAGDCVMKEMGVYNISKRELLMMAREGYELRYEEIANWFDNNRIIVYAKDANGGQYCYFYTWP